MTGTLQWLVTMAACAAAAIALLGPGQRARALAMVAALALVPWLLLAELWDREELRALRDTPLRLAVIVLVVLALVALLTLLFRRRPEALPVAIVAALPFRIPIGVGGQDVNLLLPLYAVIAAGGLVSAWAAWSARSEAQPDDTAPGAGGARFLVIMLALSVLLYGLQASYSTDLDHATETAGFFLVPFALMFRLLLDARLTQRLVKVLLTIAACEALVFALVAFGQYATRHLFWNDEVIAANDFQTFFRVNSLFWDPNILGRYLAMVVVALTACLLWVRERRPALLLAGIIAVLWGALVLTFSQSSFAALLAGLVVLAALRWSLRWTVIAASAAAAIALIYVAAFGSSVHFKLGSERALDRTTSGRADLVRGGLELAQRRPVWGFGSGSFVQSFRDESKHHAKVAASHTEPVTIAAEQGLLGLGAYLALLVGAFSVLFSGLRGVMPGIPGRQPAGSLNDGRGPPPAPPPQVQPRRRRVSTEERVVARAALAATFAALFVHTLTYAAFLSDPLSWTLLALGILLARPLPAASPAATETRTIAPSHQPAAASV
jgi:O-antigen ligase